MPGGGRLTMGKGQTKVRSGSGPISYHTGQPFESKILAVGRLTKSVFQDLRVAVCSIAWIDLQQSADRLEGAQARQQQ